MTTSTYAIDDADGQQITAGLSQHEARETARRIAAQLGGPVYLYLVSGSDEIDLDTDADGYEVVD